MAQRNLRTNDARQAAIDAIAVKQTPGGFRAAGGVERVDRPAEKHTALGQDSDGMNPLLADALSSLIGGRGEEHGEEKDEEAAAHASEDEEGPIPAPEPIPDISVLLEDEPPRNTLLQRVLLSLIDPTLAEEEDRPMSSLLADVLSSLVGRKKRERVPHRKHASTVAVEGQAAEHIALDKPRIEKRELHHVRVKTRRMKKKKKMRLIDVLPKLGLLVAVGIFAEPVIADAYKQWAYTQTISEAYSYDWEDPKYQEILEQAQLYNKMLAGTLPEDIDINTIWPYEKQLDYGSGGMMAWVEIPDLTLKLPIYHGSDDEALMAGVGHMERTSLPVGGDHTKCAISGHTGMHNERMFDSLDELEEGDTVIIHALGNDLYYSVSYKEVVEPDALDKLYIDCEDSQLVLITCTPRGINSHRLLVHAVQVDEASTQIAQNPLEAALNYLLSPTVIFLTAMVLVLLVLFLLWLFRWRKKRLRVEVIALLDHDWITSETLKGIDAGELPDIRTDGKGHYWIEKPKDAGGGDGEMEEDAGEDRDT